MARAHFRRKIVDLHKGKATVLTTDILARIAALYAIEGEVRGRPPDTRLRARQDRTRPLVVALRAVLDDAMRQLSPRSEMAKAIVYGLKLWPALVRFLDDGYLEIDNNIAERAARAASRWVAATGSSPDRRSTASARPPSSPSSKPARRTASSRKPTIADVTAKIAADWPASRWDELMPWNWQPAQPQFAQAA